MTSLLQTDAHNNAVRTAYEPSNPHHREAYASFLYRMEHIMAHGSKEDVFGSLLRDKGQEHCSQDSERATRTKNWQASCAIKNGSPIPTGTAEERERFERLASEAYRGPDFTVPDAQYPGC